MNKEKKELDIFDTLNYSAEMVEKWGKSKLPSGETLAEKFTLDGIPFWDILSPELACYHIPVALASEVQYGSILSRVRPYLSRSKDICLDLFRNLKNTQGCSTWPNETTFLCLGFSKLIYRDVLQPVAGQLAKQPNCRVVSLSDQPWHNTNQYSRHDIFYQTIWQHWNQKVRDSANKLQKKFNYMERELYASNILADIICDTGKCTWNDFKNIFIWIFRARLPRLIQQAVVAKHILEHHHPKLVISPDVADPRTRIYGSLCKKMDIQYLVVQFGLTGSEGVEWRFFSSDKAAVWGESAKEAIMGILQDKISEEQIVITGSPRYDSLVNVSEYEVKEKRKRLGLSEKKSLVLLASTYSNKSLDNYSDPELLKSMKRSIFEAADKAEGISLIVKPHPFENVRQTRTLADKYKNIIFVSRKSDIRDLIKVCDAFISFGSTATIDALVADKLTICPIFPGWKFSTLFKNSGTVLIPESKEDIMNIFKTISDGSYVETKAKFDLARHIFLKRIVYRTDGQATARATALALKMVRIGEKND